jgi:hypothetical protein
MTSIKYKLGRCPFEYMDSVRDRPWDTYGPDFSWSEFLYLKKDLEDVLDRLLDQRDELIDQINALQNVLIEHNLPFPKPKGV